MGRIKNSVYGLALGDAFGYQTEFESFANAVTMLAFDNLEVDPRPLLISDDTQMSLELINGIRDANLSGDPASNAIPYIAHRFIDWYHSPLNNRAPGLACMNALTVLDSTLKDVPVPHSYKDFMAGDRATPDSKGCGTIMRSPWIGLLNSKGVITDTELKRFCDLQSRITHGHQTASITSHLTALLASSLYRGELRIGELSDYALTFIEEHPAANKSSLEWQHLREVFHKVRYGIPAEYRSTHAIEKDPSAFFGSSGSAEIVLATAIMLIDFFGEEPLEVLTRAMFSSGDSDSIGAVAGGILGCAYEEYLWESVEHRIEEQYVPLLDDAVAFLESL